MSGEIAIRLSGISKAYEIYERPVHRLWQTLWRGQRTFYRQFWALQGIDLDIYRGETVGIVGRNGSGKSTLLQIICGTLRPTTGDVDVRGRIAPLLELGTGFNPEFTGRENVYLNATILGLTGHEVEERFDSIAAFADIGAFINSPVKTYSSGMYARLAFAVAVHVDPDILVVDEALAVGDEAFQRKCFARLLSLQHKGCTILFVSHSASNILELCTRAVLLDQGERLITSVPKTVITRYHKLAYAPPEKVAEIREQTKALDAQPLALVTEAADAAPVVERDPKEKERDALEQYDVGFVPRSTDSYPTRGAEIRHAQIVTVDGRRVNQLVHGRRYLYQYEVCFARPAFRVRFAMLFKKGNGTALTGRVSHSLEQTIPVVEAGTYRVEFPFWCMFRNGTYFGNAGVHGADDKGDEIYLHRVIDLAMFRVLGSPETLTEGTSIFSNECEKVGVHALPAATGQARQSA